MSKERDPKKETGRIRPPSAPASNVPDDISRDERARAAEEFQALNPTGRQEYQHQQLVSQLQGERDRLIAEKGELATENQRLRRIEVQHEVLQRSRLLGRIVEGVSAAAMAGGGGLISAFATSTSTSGVAFYAVGWALLGIASVVVLAKAVFNF